MRRIAQLVALLALAVTGVAVAADRDVDGQPGAKQYVIVCDVPFHIDRGMQSSFVVTP